jgi:hypothetical protein
MGMARAIGSQALGVNRSGVSEVFGTLRAFVYEELKKTFLVVNCGGITAGSELTFIKAEGLGALEL